MELDTALHNFASAFAAAPDNVGAFQVRAPRPVAEPVALGAVLRDYYARVLLSDDAMVAGALQLDLYTLEVLEARQHGWRWVRGKDGALTESRHWDKHRIVIGERNGDAIAVDSSTPGGAVYGHTGSYSCMIAADLASFFQLMAEAMVVEAHTYDYEVYDDDDNPLPAFLDELRAIARRLLGPDGDAGFMTFFFD